MFVAATMKAVSTGKSLPDHAASAAPADDSTQLLPSHSKRTERRRRKLEKQAEATTISNLDLRGFLDLPYELSVEILSLLRPSDLFALSRVSRELRAFILTEQDSIGRRVIGLRYSILARCLLRPVLLQDIDSSIHPMLRAQPPRSIAYQNIPRPDSSLTCPCLTCLVRWDILCAVVDFAHWQDHLDKREPLPTIPRGTSPSWNQELVARNAGTVIKSLTSPLWYARVLEAHLETTIRSVRRHGENKADRRPHFQMTDEDARVGTDAFLARKGPPTLEYVFSRDSFYMLEVFLPGRSWIAQDQKWVYVSASIGQKWHEMDLETVVRGAALRRQQGQQQVHEAGTQPSSGGESRGEDMP